MHEKFKGRHKGSTSHGRFRLPPEMLMEQRLPADQQSRVTTALHFDRPGVAQLMAYMDAEVAAGRMTRSSRYATRGSGNVFLVFSYDWIPQKK